MLNWNQYKIKDPKNTLQTNFNILLDELQEREKQIIQRDRIIESIATCCYQLFEGDISEDDLRFCLDNTLPEKEKSFIQHKYIKKDIDSIVTEKDLKKFIEELANTPCEKDIEDE